MADTESSKIEALRGLVEAFESHPAKTDWDGTIWDVKIDDVPDDLLRPLLRFAVADAYQWRKSRIEAYHKYKERLDAAWKRPSFLKWLFG